MKSVALSVAAICVLLATASPARGQSPPAAPAAPQIVPPRLSVEATPRYPEGATGTASVIVEILVDLDGSVSEARVVEGEEPFASSALEAARKSRFEPAQRGGKPVRARIRLASSFTPPEPPRRVLAPEPPPPGAPPVQEVVVTGRRDREPKSPTEHRMGRAEMRVIPGAFGDPFRAIDVLPGLVPIVSGLPYFYVRGAPPSAVGYYVDEVRVPYLFHFALGPGVVQPALIDEVTMHPAAFPARYGRFAGGIVAGTTREPAKELYGEGQIRLYDAGAYVEAPFAGGRGSAGVGGRYSYTAGLLSLFAPDITVDYRDYNARVSYDLSDRWRISALALGAYDYASNVEQGVEQVLFASEFHRLDTRLDHRGSDGSVSRIAATIGIDRTRLEDARFAQNIMTGVRGRHRMPITRELDVELGADALFENYRGDLPSPYAVSRRDYDQAYNLFAPRLDTATGAWVSGTYRPRLGWEVTATARGDVFTSDGETAIGPSPRLSMRVPITKRIAFLGALGIAPQPPAFAIPVPAVGYRALPGGLAYAYQKSAGAEFSLPLRFTLRTVGFHHSYIDLRDFAQDRGDLDLENPQLQPSSPAQALGLEVMLSRKMSERFAAFFSATLSRAQLGSTQTVRARVSPFDRTYVAQLGGVADLGRNWRASSRVLTYGGWPVANENDPTASGRLPAFWRVDARIEKRWVFREHRYLAFVIEGLNVTGTKEIIGRSCDGAGNCRNEDFGPVIAPSLGLEGGL
ncbi:MAG TPA: TonB family protein [Labilithrix sp.]|nr:TonB family protein [Labilithrix sp.]